MVDVCRPAGQLRTHCRLARHESFRQLQRDRLRHPFDRRGSGLGEDSPCGRRPSIGSPATPEIPPLPPPGEPLSDAARPYERLARCRGRPRINADLQDFGMMALWFLRRVWQALKTVLSDSLSLESAEGC